MTGRKNNKFASACIGMLVVLGNPLAPAEMKVSRARYPRALPPIGVLAPLGRAHNPSNDVGIAWRAAR
jgi:hypothetical protein